MVGKKIERWNAVKGSTSTSEGSQDYGTRIEVDRFANGMAHDAKEDSSKASANSDQSPKSSIKGNNHNSKHSPPAQSTKNTGHLPGDSDDDKVSEIPVKKGDCCISVGEKIIIKQKLNEKDKPSDFTLVDGAIYIRKSALDTGSTNNAAPQSDVPKLSDTAEMHQPTELPDIREEVEPGSKGVQVTNIKECLLCCQHLKCGLKELLHLCDSDPDAFIRQYEERNTHCEIQDENSDGDFMFQMDKTHGSVFGDEKYHYLMVDKSTLLNEEIPKTEKSAELPSVPTDISVLSKSVSKKSARLVIEEPLNEKKSTVPIFFNQIARTESVEDTKSSYENMIPAKVPTAEEIVSAKIPPLSETVVDDLRSDQEDTLNSNATLILKHPSNDDMQGTVSTLVELDKDSTDRSKTEEPDYSHRISIIWDDAIDPISKVVRAPNYDEKEKRVSAVSFSGVDPDKFAEIARKSAQKQEQINVNKNSIFESIVKSEMMKHPDYKSRSRGKSLIERPDSTVQKKKWFGLAKPKKQTDSGSSQPIRQSAIGRKSVIASVVAEVEEAESAYLIKEPVSEEKAAVPGSNHRNSLEAYRRRSVPVERPVFEKHRKINEYLHNV